MSDITDGTTTTPTASPTEGDTGASAPNTQTSSPEGGSLLAGGATTTPNPTTGNTETTSPTSTASSSKSSAWTTESGDFTEGWLDRLPDDLKDSAQILGQFKDLKGALKTLVNQQKLLGKKANAVMIPGENATAEEIADYRAKIGVPDSVDKYPVKPSELPEGMTWDEAKAKDYNAFAYELGLTAKQAEAHLAYEAKRAAAAYEQEQLKLKADYDAGMKTLADAWENKFETNKAIAIRKAQSLGLDLNSPGLKDPNVVIALHRAAMDSSDDKIVSGDVAATQFVGRASAMDIMNNPKNSLYADYKAGKTEVAKLVNNLLSQKN